MGTMALAFAATLTAAVQENPPINWKSRSVPHSKFSQASSLFAAQPSYRREAAIIPTPLLERSSLPSLYNSTK
jgi:hypothetical protein